MASFPVNDPMDDAADERAEGPPAAASTQAGGAAAAMVIAGGGGGDVGAALTAVGTNGPLLRLAPMSPGLAGDFAHHFPGEAGVVLRRLFASAAAAAAPVPREAGLSSAEGAAAAAATGLSGPSSLAGPCAPAAAAAGGSSRPPVGPSQAAQAARVLVIDAPVDAALEARFSAVGLPIQYPGFRSAYEKLVQFATERGFVIIIGSSEKAGIRKWWEGSPLVVGEERPPRGRMELECNKVGSAGGGRGSGVNQTSSGKCDCKFKVVYVQASGDPLVRITGGFLGHSHSLMSQEELAATARGGHAFPPELIQDLLQLTGCLNRIKPAIIEELLKLKAAAMGLSTSWSRKDLRNQIFRLRPSYYSTGDAQHLLEELTRIGQADASFVWEFDVDKEDPDSESRLSRIFWQLGEQVGWEGRARSEWAFCGEG